MGRIQENLGRGAPWSKSKGPNEVVGLGNSNYSIALEHSSKWALTKETLTAEHVGHHAEFQIPARRE